MKSTLRQQHPEILVLAAPSQVLDRRDRLVLASSGCPGDGHLGKPKRTDPSKSAGEPKRYILSSIASRLDAVAIRLEAIASSCGFHGGVDINTIPLLEETCGLIGDTAKFDCSSRLEA